MAESLRDQLLKSGIVKTVHDEKRKQQPSPAPRGGKPAHAGGKPGAGQRPGGQASNAKGTNAKGSHTRPQQRPRPAANGEIDLAKAYAIRAQTESSERKRLEQEAAELARLRKERKRRLQALLEGKALNKPDAEQMRHFEYAAKIRRVHVDAAQLVALNAGELGVVQYAGRYLLFDRETIGKVREIAPDQVALFVEPGESSGNDDGVPDDLMW
jgi:uncharacterized protein YaiL (DUF2058 family)